MLKNLKFFRIKKVFYLFMLASISLTLLGCRAAVSESSESATKEIIEKLPGKIGKKIVKDKIKESFQGSQENNSATNSEIPESWLQVNSDSNGWIYYESNYGKRMAKNIYTGQVTSW